MTKFYTCVNNVKALPAINTAYDGKPYKTIRRDREMCTLMGGKILTEDMGMEHLAHIVRTGPKFGSRGGKPGCEYYPARVIWRHWLKRGAIIELE